MVVPRGLHHHPYAAYVALEQATSTKHEFLAGEIYAVAGGSEEHSALAAEVLRALGNAIGDRPCRVHTSDLRVFVEGVQLATFPDGAVICGPLAQHAESPRATATNPMVLLEVTSDSSEEYDLGFKCESYQSLASLRDYIVVSHRARRVTVHSRADAGTWRTASAGAGGVVAVPSLDAVLDVDRIYRHSAVTE